MPDDIALPGRAFPLGATPGDGGTNIAVASECAERVQLCRFTPDGGRAVSTWRSRICNWPRDCR